jgi:hypothetical protein
MKERRVQIAILVIPMLLIALAKDISAFAQEHEPNLILENGIYILPTQLFAPEFILTYERFNSHKMSFSYSLGYKIPTGKGNSIESFGSGLFSVYENQYIFNEFSNAIYTSVAPSFYLGKERRNYIQSELFYRFYWFDNKKLTYTFLDETLFNSVRSERVHVFGLKIIIGKNYTFPISTNKILNIKVYGGIGLRYKLYKYENIDNKFESLNGTVTNNPFEVNRGRVPLFPTIQLGIKVGIARTTTNHDKAK